MSEGYFELFSQKSELEDMLRWHNGFYNVLIDKLSKLSNSELEFVNKLTIPNEYVQQINRDINRIKEKEINNDLDLGFEL